MVDKKTHLTIHRHHKNPTLFSLTNGKNVMQIKTSKTYPFPLPKAIFIHKS